MNITALYNSIFTNSNKITNENLSSLYSPNETNRYNGASSEIEEGAFKDLISSEIEKLNNQQVKADNLTQGFISGEVEDLHTVLIATEEARISLELAVQVRNKCIEAYKEINSMQI
ncbi:flagellar hook-basal body complex protein FliE [Alkalibaculum sp. M08DMB]|uniref:Flagellar hook-basal body complex protein FliE n=1 Tax=Alkalibaculum sporogenes TaxID=2655001 RepID=A0A6A7K5V1_9FIRM|nr:flagellar hook-basal body complex protein FliE [Alkalibaculum sporogenes]MPW24790.1 flagellar hook-basal body complex protein FliE [Alkalibaculum sporogenes]